MAVMLAGTDKRFAVAYDGAADTVHLTSGGSYEPLGTELSGLRDAAVVQAGAGSQRILLDGVPLMLRAHQIDGANYIALRDLAQALDCGVTYDPVNTRGGALSRRSIRGITKKAAEFLKEFSCFLLAVIRPPAGRTGPCPARASCAGAKPAGRPGP